MTRITLHVSFAALMGLLASSCEAVAGPEHGPPADRERRANILLILADDLGYSDIGAYGSEIPTPNLDRLAGEGVLFTSFHVSPSCAPSRAMLLTGVSPLEAGLGSVPEITTPAQQGRRGYAGELTNRVTTLAEHLDQAGYSTFVSGKWHLGKSPGALPQQRGFDDSFILTGGAASHFADRRGYNAKTPEAHYLENGKPAKLPAGFYSSSFYADWAINQIRGASEAGEPFFGYVAFTAPHNPLHAPDEWIARFDGAYDAGFEVIRSARVDRAKSLGIVKDGLEERPGLHLDRPWASLSPPEKKDMARRMEVYAAMIASMDHEIGRLLAELETSGELDNTLVIFLSDNGPDPSLPEEMPFNQAWVEETFDNRLENYGRPGSYISYGLDWARVSAAPFHLFKGTVGEGGMRVPAIMRLPDETGAGTHSAVYATAMDLLPTILDFASVEAGELVPGRLPLGGRSLLPMLTGDGKLPQAKAFAWQSLATRAFQQGDWKLLYVPPPLGAGKWQLYNLTEDPHEAVNLMAGYPERAARMIAEWNAVMEERGLVEPPAGMLGMLMPARNAGLAETSEN